MKPDDLTPEEEAVLRRELGIASGDKPWRGQGEVAVEPSDPDFEEPEHPVPLPEPPAVGLVESPAIPLLDLHSGNGYWQNHYFNLKPEALAAVLSICKDAIADDLTGEIERLRGLLPEV